MDPCKHLVLDMHNEVTALVDEIKALGLANNAEELDFVVGRCVADVFSHMYDKPCAMGAVDCYASDCVEGIYGGGEAEKLTGPEADSAFRYGSAIMKFGASAFEKLDALKLYDRNDVLPFSFEEFLGRDIMLEYLPPADGRK